MSLFGTFLVWLIPGAAIGFLEAWSKKVIAVLFGIIFVAYAIGMLLSGELMTGETSWGVVRFAAAFIGFLVGHSGGATMYREAFEDG